MSALTHIYTGDGKGKTTAALGLAMRFAGCGYDVVVAQFGKGSETGELKALEKLKIPVFRNSRDFGFWKSMDETERKIFYNENCHTLASALSEIDTPKFTLLVLDEIISAYNNGAVDQNAVDEIVKNKPQNVELVLTGRNAPEKLIKYADYVSEICGKKHPFECGVTARKGVEF